MDQSIIQLGIIGLFLIIILTVLWKFLLTMLNIIFFIPKSIFDLCYWVCTVKSFGYFLLFLIQIVILIIIINICIPEEGGNKCRNFDDIKNTIIENVLIFGNTSELLITFNNKIQTFHYMEYIKSIQESINNKTF
jgi:hypothetical protein